MLLSLSNVVILTSKKNPMKNLLVILACLCAGVTGKAQCNAFFPLKEKIKYQFDHFDKKDKLTLRTTQTLRNVSGTGNSMKATMVQDIIDVKKDKVISTSESEWTCDGGTLHFAITNMTMDITGDKMDIPSHLEVGQSFKDLTYNIKMGMSGMTIMNRTFTVKDRKVEGKEKVTTPAGTFDCFKMTYTTTSQGGIGAGTMKSISWYAKDTGMVKTETYSEKGSLMNRQVLSKIEK